MPLPLLLLLASRTTAKSFDPCFSFISATKLDLCAMRLLHHKVNDREQAAKGFQLEISCMLISFSVHRFMDKSKSAKGPIGYSDNAGKPKKSHTISNCHCIR